MARPVEFAQCTVAECNRDHYAKGFCRMHYQRSIKRPNDKRLAKRKPNPNSQLQKFSNCCDIPTKEGEEHQRGKQYCTGCKQPCLWRYS